MLAAKEGRALPNSSQEGLPGGGGRGPVRPWRSRAGVSLKALTIWIALGLSYVIGLSVYKTHLVEDFASQSLSEVSERHPAFRNLFQASFYFFYDDQFLPGIRENMKGLPRLKRVLIVADSGEPLFDSDQPAERPDSAGTAGSAVIPKEMVGHLGSGRPGVFIGGFQARVVMPSGQYGIVYTFDGSHIRSRIVILFLAGLGFLIGFAYLVHRIRGSRLLAGMRRISGRIWGLRAKFLLTIVLVNIITGGIVFVTLSALQTTEQSERIQKESVLFSQFSTDKIISDFSNFFYFYYQDKFLPAVKAVVATNENLVGIRIISNRTRAVLFDSEHTSSGPVPRQVSAGDKISFNDDEESGIKTRGFITRLQDRDGEPLLSVVNTYKNENQEPLFFVEYLFSFHTLKRSVAAIRKQILIDLVPSMALGLLIAIIFAQLLISPVKKLVSALRRVTEGDFDVSVDFRRSDEIGELVGAFNTMAGELRKKKELRKYLSDSTYRQVMESPELPEGARLGGRKVPATVIFTDIRNFVAHCEHMDAEEVTTMLNDYFSEMVEVVYKHGGEVDKFIGDAILAVFYATEESQTIRATDAKTGPSPEETSLQAIYCALEMRERLLQINAKRESQQKLPLEIGVGISFGEIISGPIGAKDRMDFTVIGDVVNLASRLESLSKKGKYTRVMFSDNVEKMVRGLVEYEEMEGERIRGKKEEVTVFELIQVQDLEVLLGHLKGGDLHLKLRSVELLGQSRNREAAPHVLEMLDDANEEVRTRAVAALGKLALVNDDRVLDALFRRVRVEKSERVLASLIITVGRICTTERVLEIAEFVDSPNERIMANAIEALGQIRSPKCTDLILPKLASRNNRVKANAAMALFASGHLEVIDILKPMLMHSDPLMRSSAAFAIGELTVLAQKERLIEQWKTRPQQVKLFLAEMQQAVPVLVMLLKDPDPMVKRQAVIALGKIKDKSAVLPLIETADLAKDNAELVEDLSRALREIGSHRLVREVLEKLTTS